jgi:hypothetical protein
MKKIIQKVRAVEPHMVTMLLSIVGFVGSILFYLSVLSGIKGGTIEDMILDKLDTIESKLDTITTRYGEYPQ